jgi:hypothetical protein
MQAGAERTSGRARSGSNTPAKRGGCFPRLRMGMNEELPIDALDDAAVA